MMPFVIKKTRLGVHIHNQQYQKLKLEILGIKYGIKVIYCPKYHCELNPIEGSWCYLKQYVRKRNVQNYLELHNLIREAMLSYQSSDLNFKLWKRFLESSKCIQNW